MLEKDILWLIDWYQCYGLHRRKKNGLVVVGIDNPGWGLQVDLSDTPFQNQPFERIFIDHSDTDWISCKIANNLFDCCGGPFHLERMLKTFREWIESVQPLYELQDCNSHNIPYQDEFINKRYINWLVNWYNGNSDGDWEHHFGISLITTALSTWEIQFSLSDTVLDNHCFESIRDKRSNTDWVRCEVNNHIFYGYGGLFNLPEILHCLISWANPIIAGTIA